MTTFYEADGMVFRVPRPIDGLTSEQVDAATVEVVASSVQGAIFVGTATVQPDHILIDFGPGSLTASTYTVQARLIVSGRPATFFDHTVTVAQSLVAQDD